MYSCAYGVPSGLVAGSSGRRQKSCSCTSAPFAVALVTVTIGGLLVAFGSRALTSFTQRVRRAGGVPLPLYAYEAAFAASVQICVSSWLARNAASLRLRDSVTVDTACACMPTMARMPIEK